MDDFLALLSLDFQLAVDIAFQMLPLLFHYRFISNGWDFPHALTALWVSSGCGFLNVVPNLVSLTRPSLQILSKTQMVVFLISGCQVNPLFHNYHNSRTSNDIRMKLGPVTKLDKRNKATSKKKKKKKKIGEDVNSANFGIILISTIYGQFGAYRKSDSRCLVIFINSNLLSYKNWKQD